MVLAGLEGSGGGGVCARGLPESRVGLPLYADFMQRVYIKC